MAKKLRDYYDLEYANMIGERFKAVYPLFNQSAFLQTVLEAYDDDMTFLNRQGYFATAFQKHLTGDYQQDIDIFMRLLGPELKTTEGMFTIGWWLWPVAKYVELFGVEYFDVSIGFIKELTKRHTGEFAIRPFLEKYPKETLTVCLKWSQDENVHVRRLSSEAIRIALPWAKKSLRFIEEFETCRQILNNLKADPYKFVQKSVANNLNDLFKVDTNKAQIIINEWKKQAAISKETEWIIKHAARNQ